MRGDVEKRLDRKNSYATAAQYLDVCLFLARCTLITRLRTNRTTILSPFTTTISTVADESIRILFAGDFYAYLLYIIGIRTVPIGH